MKCLFCEWGARLFAVACVVFLVATCVSSAHAQETNPKVYTNRENVRRIAIGNGKAAFATSGGVRFWDGERWREWTMREGIPTHNVLDVAFDPQNPDSRLWMLSGDWSLTEYKPNGHLYLSCITLPDGKIRTEAPSPTPPRGQSTHFSMWTDYRLRLTAVNAFVYGEGDKAALQFNRHSGAWETASPSAPGRVVPPVPASQNGYGNRLLGIKEVGQGLLLLNLDTGFFLSDGSNASPIFFPFPWQPTYAYGGNYPVTTHSALFDVKADAKRAGVVTFSVIEQQKHYNTVGVPAAPSWLARYCAEVVKEKNVVREVSRRRLSTLEMKRLAKQVATPDMNRNRLNSGWLTDVAVEPGPNGTIWFATYNQPGIHATGITRYNRKTHVWTYPEQGETGIAANQITGLHNTRNHTVAAGTTNGASTYVPSTDTWREGGGDTVTPPGSRQYFTRYVPDPEKKNRSLQVLGEEEGGRKVWVRWRAEFKTYSPWPLGRVDTDTNTLETAAAIRPELDALSVTDFRLTGDSIWILGEDRVQVPNGPVVVHWDRRAGKVTRYRTSLWEGDKDMAKAFAGNLQPGAYLYEAAGTIWVKAVFSLFRLDRATDTWQQEPLGAGFPNLSAFPDALWVQQAAGVLRWRDDGKGWQRLVVPEGLDIFARSIVPAENGDLWLGGLGVLHLPKEAITFAPREAK